MGIDQVDAITPVFAVTVKNTDVYIALILFLVWKGITKKPMVYF
jgi:hypothetical protein